MNAKSIIAVIITAILIGVLYVLFEKNLTGGKVLSNSQSSSSQELTKQISEQSPAKQTSLLNLPSPEASTDPITGSTDLLKEAEGLQMRDYSGLFEDLKKSINQ